jgi:hypothetical protein
MYRKDLLKDWSNPHLTECEQYLDYTKDCTPSSKVSLCESFEHGFIEKVIKTPHY